MKYFPENQSLDRLNLIRNIPAETWIDRFLVTQFGSIQHFSTHKNHSCNRLFRAKRCLYQLLVSKSVDNDV